MKNRERVSTKIMISMTTPIIDELSTHRPADPPTHRTLDPHCIPLAIPTQLF